MMYYIESTQEIFEELPKHIAACSEDVKASKGVGVLIDKGASVETPVKSHIVPNAEGGYIQVYLSVEEFEALKERRIVALNKAYENTIDKVVRKSTQDLVFGDIKELPKEVIKKREQYKIEYHRKVAAIKSANDVSGLNALPL